MIYFSLKDPAATEPFEYTDMFGKKWRLSKVFTKERLTQFYNVLLEFDKAGSEKARTEGEREQRSSSLQAGEIRVFLFLNMEKACCPILF